MKARRYCEDLDVQCNQGKLDREEVLQEDMALLVSGSPMVSSRGLEQTTGRNSRRGIACTTRPNDEKREEWKRD